MVAATDDFSRFSFSSSPLVKAFLWFNLSFAFFGLVSGLVIGVAMSIPKAFLFVGTFSVLDGLRFKKLTTGLSSPSSSLTEPSSECGMLGKLTFPKSCSSSSLVVRENCTAVGLLVDTCLSRPVLGLLALGLYAFVFSLGELLDFGTLALVVMLVVGRFCFAAWILSLSLSIESSLLKLKLTLPLLLAFDLSGFLFSFPVHESEDDVENDRSKLRFRAAESFAILSLALFAAALFTTGFKFISVLTRFVALSVLALR